MAGHSHFANIMHKKARADAKRGKAFSKISRLIMAAVRLGGPKPEDNPRLALAIDKARAANMPKDTIKRAIDRASGAAGGGDFAELTYEGYGPNGVAILIEALTDNRNRTNTDVNTIFNKNGGSMGQSGSVAYLFERKGEIEILAEQTSEEQLFEVAVEAGADDVSLEAEAGDDPFFLITSDVPSFQAVRAAIEAAGLEARRAELTMVPTTTVEADETTARKVMKLQGLLEDNDDVQSVTTNLDVSPDVAAKLAAD
ncbi:MAG: YebC/PmpR family DNA-binding transcriptional regulator [Planctomycetota bacterium]|nr:YebC/PmpR family DNA-binding transcriptional regulator [Planctomycetota bacterium]